MEQFIVQQTGSVLAMVQAIFNQPQAFIGQLEAWLRAEVAGLETRLKEKIQEVTLDDREKKRQLVEEVDDCEGKERKSQKVNEEMASERELLELETPPLLEDEDEQNKKRPRDEEVPFDETGGGSECFYNCFGSSGRLVQCDRCDIWFHPKCAGYVSELLENPEFNGHPISLNAYCLDCLDFMDLTHADIVEQEEEYLRLEKFFQANAASWSWQPVPQDGFCCLNGIWIKHPGPFESLEKLISACATAAIDEVDMNDVETRAGKCRLKVVFKQLAKNPDRLREMWPDLEVQYMWLALAKSVFHDVRLKLHTLQLQGDGKIELRCMQSIPDENIQRDYTVNILQWNSKVTAHYDLIEGIVGVVDGAPPKADENPAQVDDAAPNTGDDEEVQTVGAVPKVNEMVAQVDDPIHIWPVGSLLEAEMMDPNYPNYRDTLHPVKVIEVMDDGTAYRCELLAFKNSTDVWSADLLHESREHDENAQWKEDDRVHFRIRNRKVGKVKVDGNVSKKGIWVKGVVVESRLQESGRVVIEHVDWGNMDEEGEMRKKVTHVLPPDIRWAADPCNDVVFRKEVGRAGPFNSETEKERLMRDPLTDEDWQSITKNNTWVRSGIVDRMVSYFNLTSNNESVLVTNIALEHALFPNFNEVTDLKAFLDQNNPAKIGTMWRQRWTSDLEYLLMPVNIGNVHWCLLVVNLRNGSVELWDSMKGPDSDWYGQIDRDRLQAFLRVFSPETPDLQVSIAQVPQQSGKTNCGVFMLELIRAFLQGERDGSKVDVPNAQMSEFRARIGRDLKGEEEIAPIKKRAKK